MSRKDILGNDIKTECIGCSIANGEIELPGGILYDGKSIILAADPEILIPGFLIITSKRHIQSFSELAEDERIEIGNTIAWAEKAIKDLNIAETVTLVQEERSKHFHIWIFPNQEWMKEKFGFGLQHMRDINSYARENATSVDTENVIKTIEQIRDYMKSKGIGEKA
nr:HIT family hydrolase [uncultured Butyrivibrio sp.]